MPDTYNTLMGFDFGMKVIGVAVGQTITQTATALNTLPAKSGAPQWPSIQQLIDTWQVQAFVVGIPYDLQPHNKHIADACLCFADALFTQFKLPVFLVDEGYTSVEAKRQATKKQKRYDSIAAQIILESWLTNPQDVTDAYRS